MMSLDNKISTYAQILKNGKVKVFEYHIAEDIVYLYDENLNVIRELPNCLSYLENDLKEVHPEDQWMVVEFFRSRRSGPIEVRCINKEGIISRQIIERLQLDWEEDSNVIFASVKDITNRKKREELLEHQARRDYLTSLYNRYFGKKLINDYLTNKNPYDSCGLMVIDIDYFKNVNDMYGHSFGDEVLAGAGQFFLRFFDEKDIKMRAGGDEFVILLKDINHPELVKKSVELVQAVRKLKFSKKDYAMTCSVGVCFLPENISGYTYDQLFADADWGLYRAKENGRNGYAFCDNLRRFETGGTPDQSVNYTDIDARYLHNDIVSTAFEIFEKINSFDTAMDMLLKIAGIRLQLDRITVIQTSVKEQHAGRQYQWVAEDAPAVLDTPGSFTKEDFLTLFHSYDEYGTTVLQHDDLDMYSPQARALLVQGEAKTVVYAAMYCEGKYTGAISYVVCDNKRYWTKDKRKILGELTKIVSAHLSKHKAMNSLGSSTAFRAEYDSLTGLLAFSKFREEIERLIVGGYAKSHVVVYTDFENFKSINEKYGYSAGDHILKEFCNFVIGSLNNMADVYFTRVVSDQFILFMPYKRNNNMAQTVHNLNEKFTRQQALLYPDIQLRIRTGIYYISPECLSASEAIDFANDARKQVAGDYPLSAKVYEE